MATRIKISKLKKLLEKLDNFYVTVLIPRLSLEIMTEFPIEDVIEETKKNSSLTVHEFLGNNHDKVESARLSYTNQGYVYAYMYEEIPPIDFANGEPIKSSLLKLREAYLPLSFVIQLYNNGYSVRVRKMETLLAIIDKLEEVLNSLEVYLNTHNPELLEFIEDFYNAIIEGREKEIERYLEDRNLEKLKRKKSLLSLLNERKSGGVDTASIITKHNGEIDIFDLDDIVIK